MIIKTKFGFYYKTSTNNDYLLEKYGEEVDVFNKKEINYSPTYDYYYFILPNCVKEMVDANIMGGHPCGTRFINSNHFRVKGRKYFRYKKNNYLIIHTMKGSKDLNLCVATKKHSLAQVGINRFNEYEKINMKTGEIYIVPPHYDFYLEGNSSKNDNMILKHEIFLCGTEGYLDGNSY